MIITTHAHFDHVFGSGYYKNLLQDVQIYAHKNDATTWKQGISRAAVHGIAVPKDHQDAADFLF